MDIVHIEKLVEEAYSRHVTSVIDFLKGLGREHMQSPDDSPYENVWQEFAVQIQGEESIFWELYEDMVRDLCYDRVHAMARTELQLLWFFTEPGEEWTWDIDYDKEHGIERDPDDDEPASFDPDDVVQTMYEKIASIAADEDLPSEYDDEEEDDEEEEDEEEENEELEVADETVDANPKEATISAPPRSTGTLTLSLFD